MFVQLFLTFYVYVIHWYRYTYLFPMVVSLIVWYVIPDHDHYHSLNCYLNIFEVLNLVNGVIMNAQLIFEIIHSSLSVVFCNWHSVMVNVLLRCCHDRHCVDYHFRFACCCTHKHVLWVWIEIEILSLIEYGILGSELNGLIGHEQ